MEKKSKTHLREIGKFTSVSVIGEIARYLLLLAASALVTNTFGVKIYGQYAYIISFITILITFSGLGIGSGVVYFGQKFRQTGQDSKARGLMGFAYMVVAAAGGLLTALVMIFSEPISKILLNSTEYSALLFRMAPLIFIESLYGLSLSIFKSMKRIARLSLVRNIFYHVIRITVILICFILLDIKNINGLIISTYAAYISVLLYSLYNQYKNQDIGKVDEISTTEKKDLIKYSLPLFMTSIIYVLLREADILMLGYMKTEDAVAVYKISVQICAIIPFLKHITSTFFGPMISSLYHAGKREEMINVYKTITKWSFTVGVMVFLGIILFGESALHLFGRDFIYGYKALVLVACGSLAGVITGQAGSMNSMTGHPRFSLVSSASSFTVNIILNVIMIPKLGIIGAAIATLAASLLGNTLSLIYLYAKQKIHPYDIKFIKPIVAGGIAYLVIFLLNHLIMWDGVTDILIKGFLFAIIFTGTIIILKLDNDDKIILKSMYGSVSGLIKRR